MKYLVLVVGFVLAVVIGALTVANSAAPTFPPDPAPVAAVPDAPRLKRIDSWTITGKIPEAGDVSGVAVRGDLLLLISDETAQVDILRKTKDGYEVGEPVVFGDKKNEMDLEAI